MFSHLQYANDMILFLSNGVRCHKIVIYIVDFVVSMDYGPLNSTWLCSLARINMERHSLDVCAGLLS